MTAMNSRTAQPWMPPSALAPAKFDADISAIVQAWAERWFTKLRPVVRVKLRDASLRLSDRAKSRRIGADLAVGSDRAAQLAIVEAMVGRPIAANSIKREDEPLFAHLASTCVDDLVRRTGTAVKMGEVAVEDGDIAAPAIIWEIGPQKGGSSLTLAMSRTALVRWRKHGLASALPVPLLGDLRQALARQSAPIELVVGKAHIDISAMATLEVGDVVLLDRKVDDAVPIKIAGRPAGMSGTISSDSGATILKITKARKA